MEHDVLNVRETAHYLKFNQQTIRRLAREGHLPAFRVGGNWRFKKSTLDEWFVSRKITTPTRTVLVVDDESNVNLFIKDVLEEKGFAVTTAFDGVDGLEKINQKLPDIVVLDLKMPRMDGATMLEHLRASHPEMPVVLITGYPDGELMMRALKFSPFLMLAKPATPDMILKAVRRALAPEEKTESFIDR